MIDARTLPVLLDPKIDELGLSANAVRVYVHLLCCREPTMSSILDRCFGDWEYLSVAQACLDELKRVGLIELSGSTPTLLDLRSSPTIQGEIVDPYFGQPRPIERQRALAHKDSIADSPFASVEEEDNFFDALKSHIQRENPKLNAGQVHAIATAQLRRLKSWQSEPGDRANLNDWRSGKWQGQAQAVAALDRAGADPVRAAIIKRLQEGRNATP